MSWRGKLLWFLAGFIAVACVALWSNAHAAGASARAAPASVLPFLIAGLGIAAIACFVYAVQNDSARAFRVAGALLIVFLIAVAVMPIAHAAEVRIPAASLRYRVALEQAAGEQWGLSAPVARVAAQLQQESGWNPRAHSEYAQGLAQFTPPTAQWLPTVCPHVGPPDPWDAQWSLRAAVCYDAWLHDRAAGHNACARWAMTLSAYNGGEAARDRERALARKAGADPDAWFDAVDGYRARGKAAWKQNRMYVWRILRVLEPAYVQAGWPGEAACS